MLFMIVPYNTLAIVYRCNVSASCGCSTEPVITSRIFGGETAVNGSWGWAVTVHLNYSSYCTGTLISSSWVLVSATYLRNYRASEIYVSAATNTLLGRRQWQNVSAIYRHPYYNEKTALYNIALLRLSLPFNMTRPTIAQICLPRETTEDYPPVNASILAIGWGKTGEDEPVPRLLQQVTMQRLGDNVKSCTKSIENKTIEFCFGAANKTICAGDNGGPVMIYTASQQWVLVGIISYSYGCYDTGYASISTRIIPVLPWLRSMNITDLVTVTKMDPATNPTATVITTSTGTSFGSRSPWIIALVASLLIMSLSA